MTSIDLDGLLESRDSYLVQNVDRQPKQSQKSIIYSSDIN